MTVAGSAATNCSAGNGRYSRTLSRPTFSPRRTSSSTVSWTAPTPDPMSDDDPLGVGGAVVLDQVEYRRPVRSASSSKTSETIPGTAS